MGYQPSVVQTAQTKLPVTESDEVTTSILNPSPEWQRARAKFPEPVTDEVTTSPSHSPGWEQAKVPAELERLMSLQWISLDKPLSVEAATAYLTYLNNVEKSIEGRWKYPEQATRNREDGKVNLDVTIRQDGWLENIRVVRSSGSKSFDNQAIKSVVSGEQYDPLPEIIGLETINIRFTFNYDLTERSD